MIEIKQDKCVIQIYDDAHLSEMGITKLRKLLKIASNKRQNDPQQIKNQLLDLLYAEEKETQSKIDGHVVYGEKDETYFRNKLKKIKKLWGIVKQWDI